MLCFGVYGGVATMELLQCLKDGGARTVVFVGSMGAKKLPIGTIVLPAAVVDRAGIVSLDDPNHSITHADPVAVKTMRLVLKANGIRYEEATIVSVPSVLHGVESILSFVKGRHDVAGVELELSTLYHFAKKLGIRAYALVYVYDNAQHSIIDRPESLEKVRREAYQTIQLVVKDLLRTIAA